VRFSPIFPEGHSKELPKMGLPGGQNLSKPHPILLPYMKNTPNANKTHNPNMSENSYEKNHINFLYHGARNAVTQLLSTIAHMVGTFPAILSPQSGLPQKWAGNPSQPPLFRAMTGNLSAFRGKYISEKRTPKTNLSFFVKNRSLVSKRISKTDLSGNQSLVSLFG